MENNTRVGEDVDIWQELQHYTIMVQHYTIKDGNINDPAAKAKFAQFGVNKSDFYTIT